MENVEAIVIQWLNDNFDIPAYADMPKNPPASFALVDRSGGGREAMVLDMAEILIEVYDKTSRLNASNNANLIADRVPELLSNHNITRASVNSVVQLGDTTRGLQRYQVYVDVYMRR